MRIGIYIYENCMYSTAVGLCDMFAVANHLNRQFQIVSDMKGRFETRLVSWDGAAIKAGNGRSIVPDGALKTMRTPDVLIIPGMLDSRTVRHVPLFSKKLRSIKNKGTVICSVCAGSCFLAAAGILTDKKATTHWNLIAPFREAFPSVRWVPNQLLVRDENIITTGGVSSWQELGLFLIELFGSTTLARYTSSFMLIEPGRDSQAPYRISMLPKSHPDEQIRSLQTWMEENHTHPICLQDMIDKAGMSERNLIRRFKKATGYTPLQYLQEQRLHAAKELLEKTQHSFEEITWKVGYQDVNSFRDLFKKRNGITPGGYRKRFSQN